jgi:hypothetical protein
MKVETLQLLRNILLRTFVVGVLLAVVLALLTYLQWETIMYVLTDKLHMSNREPIETGFVELFVAIRFFLIFCILAPALALHWTVKKMNS